MFCFIMLFMDVVIVLFWQTVDLLTLMFSNLDFKTGLSLEWWLADYFFKDKVINILGLQVIQVLFNCK